MLVLNDKLESLPSHTIRCAARVRSFAFDPSYNKHSGHGQSQSQSKGTMNKDCKGMLSLVNNTLEVYVIPLTSSVESSDDKFKDFIKPVTRTEVRMILFCPYLSR